MALNMTTFAAALKQHYTSEKIENMVYKDNPFLAMLSKYEDFGGDNLKLPIKYGIPQGRSATFSDAQANKTNTQLKAFLLTRVSDYSLASIQNEVIEASKGNANAFIEAATTEIDGAIESATRSLAIGLFGDGGGSIGQIDTTVAGTTLTLNQVDDVTNFEVGMQIDFYSAATGGAIRAGGPLTINSVNRDAGSMVVSANLNTITGITALDFIVPEGDYDLKVKGLKAWIPSAAPTAGDSFFSVDRSADATRLAGIRFSGSSLPLEEALIGAAARVAREGGKPDVCFVNYSNFADLEKALGSKVSYVDVKVAPEIGFRGILIHGPRGPIKVVPDQNCPKDVAFMLQMDVWKLYSLGKAPKILDSDGLKFLRDSNADSVEVRVGYYAQVGCRGPGYNVRIALS
tara:strand:- start:111 stop:1316 length:1206 start_codon:yes stop_codon:yes gene_type:complete